MASADTSAAAVAFSLDAAVANKGSEAVCFWLGAAVNCLYTDLLANGKAEDEPPPVTAPAVLVAGTLGELVVEAGTERTAGEGADEEGVDPIRAAETVTGETAPVDGDAAVVGDLLVGVRENALALLPEEVPLDGSKSW